MAIDAKAMTLGDILKESESINVPRYQRPYKWERKLIEDIFEDVLMYGGGSRGVGGFMGSIVFCPGSDGAVDVVDGIVHVRETHKDIEDMSAAALATVDK